MAISASFSDMVVMHEFMNTTRRRLQPGTRIQQYSFCQFFEQFKIRSQSYPPFRVMCVCVCRCVDPIRRSVGCNCFYFSGPSRHNCMIFFHRNRFTSWTCTYGYISFLFSHGSRSSCRIHDTKSPTLASCFLFGNTSSS